MVEQVVCSKCKETSATDGDLCVWCHQKKKFAEFAESCGLERYPDPTGERYVYGLNGSCQGKKSECVDLIDELWNALVKAKNGDESLLVK